MEQMYTSDWKVEMVSVQACRRGEGGGGASGAEALPVFEVHPI